MSGYQKVLLGNGDQSFPGKRIRKSRTPSSVAFFIWTATLEKILMIDNLQKKNVWLLDQCYMCNCNWELVDHLLLQCPYCYKIVIYGVEFIWSLLGDAEDCC